MQRQGQISDDLKTALNIAVPLVFKKMDSDLDPLLQTAVKLLIQYRAAATGLDEKIFLRPGFNWRESSLENEPYKGELNDFLNYVTPKLSGKTLHEICYENPFRPRLTVELPSSKDYQSFSEIKLIIKINNQALSKIQLKYRLEDYQRRNIPIIIEVPSHVASKIEKAVIADYRRAHSSGQVFISNVEPPKEIKLPTSSDLDPTEPLYDLVNFWDFTNEILEYGKAIIPEDSYYRSIFKPGYRRELKENLARNALIDKSAKLGEKFGYAVDTLAVVNTFYKSYPTDGFQQASWESCKTASTIVADRVAYYLLPKILIKLTGVVVPGPLYVVLWSQAGVVEKVVSSVKDWMATPPLPQLPQMETHEVTKDLKDFYLQLCVEGSSNIPALLPETNPQNHPVVVKTPHQHVWYGDEKKTELKTEKLEQKIQILFTKPNYADYRNRSYLQDYPVPKCVTGASLPEQRISLRDWQASYSFPVKDYNVSIAIDLPSLAYFLWRQCKYWRMSPAKKIGIELFGCAEKYCQKPNRRNLHLLDSTLHDYLNLHPRDSKYVARMRYAAVTGNIEGMQALMRNDLEGYRRLDQTYADHYQRLQNFDPGNIPELIDKFPDEPGRFAYISGYYLDNLDPAQGRMFSLKGINELKQKQADFGITAHEQTILDTLESVYHDSLIELTKNNPSWFKQLRQFNAEQRSSKPADESIKSREMNGYEQLKHYELALAVSKELSPSSKLNYRQALMLVRLGNHDEALAKFQIVIGQEGDATYSVELLETLLEKQNDLAYRSATQMRDLLLEQKLLKEAGVIGEIICNQPCELSDFKVQGDIKYQQGDHEAAVSYYVKFIENAKVLSIEMNEVLLRLGEYYKEKAPGTALNFYYKSLNLEPNIAVISQCEDILVKHKQYLELRKLYLSLQGNSYAIYKLGELDKFIKQSTQFKFADGLLTLIQMATPMAIHHFDENETAIKALRVVQVGVDIAHKLLPHYAEKVKPGWIKKAEAKPTSLQKGIANLSNLIGGMSAIVQFTRLYQNSINSKEYDQVLTKAAFALEGATLMAETVQMTQPFFSEIKGLSELKDMVAHFSVQQSWDAAIHLGKNISETISQSGWQAALETYGEGALATASMISLGMKIYEYNLQATGKKLPENEMYHGLKNLVTYTSISITAASKMGLTVAGVKAGMVAAGSGVSWTFSAIAAGGTQTALGVAAGTGGLGIAAVGVYAGYQGVKLIHNATTVQNKASAMEYNLQIGELEKKKEFGAIIEGLKQIDQYTGKDKNQDRIGYYQCQRYLEEKRFAEAEKLSGQLLQNKSLDKQLQFNLKQIFLVAYAGLSADKPVDIEIPLGVYREMIKTVPAEQKQHCTQIVKHILDNHFDQWQVKSSADSKPKNWPEGLVILQKIAEIDPGIGSQQRIDLYLCSQYLEEKNHPELSKLQQKLASQQLQPQQAIFLKKIQFNVDVQLAADDKPVDQHQSAQHYQDIMAATDEKEQEHWTQKMVFIHEKSMIRAAKAGESLAASQSAEQAYQLNKQPFYQQRRDFYQVAHLFEQKKYLQADQLSTQLLANGESMSAEFRAGVISLKLNVAAAGLEAKEIKPDIDQLWKYYLEINHEGSSNQQQIILFLLRKTAQEEEQQGRFSKAQEQCQRMLTLQPKNSELIKQNMTYEYQIHLQSKDYTKLLEKCHTELAFNSKNELALKYEGLAYLSQQKLRDSMHSFEKLTIINTQEPEPLIYLSEIASAMQNFVKAQTYLRRAILLTQTKQKQFSTEHPEEKDNGYTKQLAELNKFEQSIQDRCSQIIRSSMGETSGKILGHCISLSLWAKPLSSRLFVQKPHSYPITYTP